jgi:hypothetical protein
VHSLGDTPGDRPIARNPDDQCAFTVEKSHNAYFP